MLPIPQDVLAQFIAILKYRKVPERFSADYMKWLRYYLSAIRDTSQFLDT